MTDITDELREWVMRNIAINPAPTGSIANTDASSGNALSGKGGGRAGEGGNKRARATDRRGGGAASDLGKEKKAGADPRQLVGREVTTSNKGTRFRVYRTVPLLAVVVDGEE